MKPLPFLSRAEKVKSEIGTHLFLVCMTLLFRVALGGGWIAFEHPSFRGRKPFPSFFNLMGQETSTSCFTPDNANGCGELTPEETVQCSAIAGRFDTSLWTKAD